MTSWVPQKVGCDDILGSDAAEDACGVCQGNNSSCTTHKGLYAKQHRANRESTLGVRPPTEQRWKGTLGGKERGVVRIANRQDPESPM